MIPDHLKSQRALTNGLAEAARAAGEKLAEAAETTIRAAAAFEGKIEEIEADEMAEFARHTAVMLALGDRRSRAWRDYDTAACDGHRRIRAVSLELAGGAKVQEFRQQAAE